MSDYQMTLGSVTFPVMPPKISYKIGNNNKEYILIDGQYNKIRGNGLKEIEFEVEFPSEAMPYAFYINNEYKKPFWYLDQLEKMKDTEKPIEFVLTRNNADGTLNLLENLAVSIEDIKPEEKAPKDLYVSLKLKEYVEYTTKSIKIIDEGNEEENENAQAVEEKDRGDLTGNEPKADSYTVKSGDTLWAISKMHFGSGNRWREIYELNKDKINNPNLIYPNQEIRLPTKE